MDLRLTSEQICLPSDPNKFDFETTEELEPHSKIIGQPRGIKAINFGVSADSPGYNIFVMGESGTGRTTAIKRFIEEKAKSIPAPDDWVYVNNFLKSHFPIALRLDPGKGKALQDALDQLIEQLQAAIPRAFESEAYREEIHQIEENVSTTREQELNTLQERVREQGGALIAVAEGLQIIPAAEGQPLTPEQFAALPQEEQEEWRETSRSLERQLEDTLRRLRDHEGNAQGLLQGLIRKVASSVVHLSFEPVSQLFAKNEAVIEYLGLMKKDIIDNVQLFQHDEKSDIGKIPAEIRFRRYRVNVIVDHSRIKGAPVVVENNPTVSRLLGRVEHEAGFGGAITTDFTMIRGGALQTANGGFLVLRTRDLLSEPRAWDSFKRALVGRTVCPDDPAARDGAATLSLDPEPIPLDLKVILIGPPEHYFMLHANDEDFRAAFKVVADFGVEMERTSESEREYATFIATRCHEEGLLPFDRGAVSRVVEQGSRLAGSQKKLSTHFGDIADLIREGSHWAEQAGRKIVTSEDIMHAIRERIYFQGRVEARLRERILDGTLLISTSGEVIGQVNSLTVAQVGEHRFGQPSRVTARTYMGKGGIVQIDREVHLAGPIHNKGVMTLIGYLGGRYATEQPLSISAQITFEQSYGGIEGDSASAAELYALLSSLSGIPINQEIALTGSINQLGEIQAIGGISEKVESWFKLCEEQGFSGNHGVILPSSNVEDLMLDEPLRDVVDKEKFNLWAISTIDDGLEILMGRPAEEVHEAVQNRLLDLAKGLESFGKKEE
jgi:lon-related putative ATP-dependent protease